MRSSYDNHKPTSLGQFVILVYRIAFGNINTSHGYIYSSYLLFSGSFQVYMKFVTKIVTNFHYCKLWYLEWYRGDILNKYAVEYFDLGYKQSDVR